MYKINKGINRSIEFKGIQAQYIIYLALGLVGLLLSFALLYMFGVNLYVCLLIIIPSGAVLYFTVQRYSRRYGEHGLVKKVASKQLPRSICTRTRHCFLKLIVIGNEKG
ncbi:DUF4133 domain-containing protein [Paraflavitalea sp. CAU 1676]|uniref:DUF4133 domain-containing protein n=1 Tax=Paraflavitalea sp. CAU 1676 TaxID=3032598 RepID=UPI0023DA9673|nr:DUF4133 domain-containing protein [Paraflavitalea sp. CAU 1676]MDF2190512.1 DUF4133 domain-containing protein [Paraflavitalea sp. CAU 1676]